jgi:hypothetical protein
MSDAACSVTPVMSTVDDSVDARGPAPEPREPLRDASLDRALDQTLARLDGLDAVGVHEHVEVYTAVDRALRERLAATEA